jgi:hypothetical protein
MTANVHHRPRVAEHEAAHVAGAVMLRGSLPEFASADRPEHGLAGVTRLDFTDDGLDEEPEDFLVIALAGPLAHAADDWPPAWPIEPDRVDAEFRSDARALESLGRYCDLDKAGFERVCDRAAQLTEQPDFWRLVRLVARALELVGELTADDLRRLLPERLFNHYVKEPA